jgi:CheY-like chemotaxis protein
MPSYRILSVDDDPNSQKLIAKALDQDHQLFTVQTVRDAVQAAQQHQPDLILMDINLSDGTGYEACRNIMLDCQLDPPDIVFISALTSVADRLEAYRCGGTDYLAKPIEPSELRTKVSLALELRKQSQQLKVQAQQATDTAMTAISNIGEQGALLNFATESYQCSSLPELAELTFKLLNQFNLKGALLLQAQPEAVAFSSSGLISPLENKLMYSAAGEQRILSKGNRTLFCDQNTTLLIRNMPVEQAELYGRLKDHLALLCKVINATIKTLDLEYQAQQKRESLAQTTVEQLKGEMTQLDQNILQVEAKLRHLMDDLLMFYEEELLSLGLTSEQEERLLTPMVQTKEQLNDVFDITESLEANMLRIEQGIINMTKVSA